MSTTEADLSGHEPLIEIRPSETLERLRVASASRTSLLKAAHRRLEDDLRELREKAITTR